MWNKSPYEQRKKKHRGLKGEKRLLKPCRPASPAREEKSRWPPPLIKPVEKEWTLLFGQAQNAVDFVSLRPTKLKARGIKISVKPPE